MPALIPIGAAVIGGAISSRSAKKAAETQADSTREASAAQLAAQREAQAFQQKQFDQTRADQAPWRETGAKALNQLAAAPDFSFDASGLANDPGYQFGLNQGMRGLTNSAAARGNLLSGAALKASTRYAQDYAGTKVNEAFGRQMQTDQTNKNRLASLAGVGQTSVGQTTQAGMQFGQNIGAGMMQTGQNMGNNLIGAGNARASGYMAQGNALTDAINQGVSAWQNRNKPENGYGYGPNASNITPGTWRPQ